MHNLIMKKMMAFICVLSGLTAAAQENVPVTNQLLIEGRVKAPYSFRLADAKGYTISLIDSLVIYNHLHVRKKAIRNIKGILLKDILAKAGIDEANPKLLSEYYFTCTAAD